MIEREPLALAAAKPYLIKHRDAFMQQVGQRKPVLKAQFDAIDVLEYRLTYEQAAASASAFLKQL